MSKPVPLNPVATGERIEILDSIRGFALLGVLQMNLVFFSGTDYLAMVGRPWPTGPAGAWLVGLRDWLLAGKSIALFSLLFGVGLSIQMGRARARGAGFGGFAARRLVAMLLLGLLHVLLIWNGDILHIYALGGVLLLPFLGRPAWVPAGAALALAVAGAFRLPLFAALHLPGSWLRAECRGQAGWMLEMAQQGYGQGSWLEATVWRLREWLATGPEFATLCFFRCLPLFLLGPLLWRSGLLAGGPGQPARLRRLFHATFWAGLALSWAFPPPECPPGGLATLPALAGEPARALGELGLATLALGYLFGFLLLQRRLRWRPWLALLAPMGRMALTNYLAQSLVCCWIFNRHGLGLWLRVGPAPCILFGLALFAVQVAWSHGWLARFRFGPLEWLWRVLSYRRLEPLRGPTTPRAHGDLVGEDHGGMAQDGPQYNRPFAGRTRNRTRNGRS